MATVHAGTSGYSYKEWKGTLFPENLRQDDFLAFYASRFSTVEINNTFYRFPTPEVLEAWSEQTPPGFTFAIKANKRITHTLRLKNAAEVTGQFVERCRLLGQHLGPVLFQLPPQFQRHDSRLESFLEALPRGVRYALEFRHPSWHAKQVFELLEITGVALALSEDDKLSTPLTSTAGYCYLRLRKDSYGPDELATWRSWIEERQGEGREVFVYLKHDEAGSSPEPAIRLLEGQPLAP
jgi:uncharacterized protein YecE (DUF72 family)